jgi:hypothetical protein
MHWAQKQVAIPHQTSEIPLDDAVAAEWEEVHGQEFGFHSKTLSPKRQEAFRKSKERSSGVPYRENSWATQPKPQQKPNCDSRSPPDDDSKPRPKAKGRRISLRRRTSGGSMPTQRVLLLLESAPRV